MKFVKLGDDSVSAIGVGTWQFGSKEWGYGGSYAQSTAKEILHRAIELKVNFIDTAELYGFGASEKIVGGTVETDRSKAFLATKFFPIVPLPSVLVERAYSSAKRLKTDVIDLYQLHFPNALFPLELQVGGIRRLLDRGTIRYAGVSNFSLDYWKRAELTLGRPLISNQVHLSLITQGPLLEMHPWALAHDRVLIAYSPLEQGLLGGRYGVDSKPSGFRRYTPNFRDEFLLKARPLLSRLNELARTYDATPAQISLAWLLKLPNVVVIPGASSVSQLEANVRSVEIDLSDDEFEELREMGHALSRK
ncbi:Predicted oxidoreductase [Ferrithrix thermotolerans DSM 19514]|jgi:aryl-alcohol dehydrogenase-like predicted oxidoreductase|uniref:Predicted oxidoreductase n=1 Tax=Ferrithrix thermotolerans DSM 19514 TaxID=1121881 RepID=A0A1M4V7C8_9ACTN|nr:aldo/keto reductase [Ferrithrix thermotolerans]SHE64859.1 Predicted oxidoreductase [Ferrithrix thermotolerans DSM 19514]